MRQQVCVFCDAGKVLIILLVNLNSTTCIRFISLFLARSCFAEEKQMNALAVLLTTTSTTLMMTKKQKKKKSTHTQTQNDNNEYFVFRLYTMHNEMRCLLRWYVPDSIFVSFFLVLLVDSAYMSICFILSLEVNCIVCLRKKNAGNRSQQQTKHSNAN